MDRRWSEAMLDIRTPFLTNVALVFNWLGRGLGSTVTLAAVGIALIARRRWLALLAFAVTEAATTLSSTLLKVLVGRPRPPDGLVHPVGSSFPSGHAAYVGATCVSLVLLFTMLGSRRRWWSALAALGVLGMAWSRTYLQVHWFSDVVGGSLLGVGFGVTIFAGAQRMSADTTCAPAAQVARNLAGCEELGWSGSCRSPNCRASTAPGSRQKAEPGLSLMSRGHSWRVRRPRGACRDR